MIPVKDRIPTKPYRRKITHEESALPQYSIDEYGHLIITIPNVEYAIIERADEPTEDGTPINKLLFDSIDTDVRARLEISSKATNAEIEAGTDDTKYTTSSKVQHKLDSLVITRAGQNGATLVDLTQYTGKIVTITGYGESTGISTTFSLKVDNTTIMTSSTTRKKYPFTLTFDLTANTYYGMLNQSSGSSVDNVMGSADSFSELTLTKSGSANIDWEISIQVSN